MLGLLVPVEDGPLVEAPATCRAVVRLLSCVDPLMADQPLTLAKALPTHLATIGLLPRVCPSVHSQVGIPAEAFAALACVGFLASVSSPVYLQVLPAAEALPAVTTLVGLLPRVAPLVHLKVVALAESLPALATHVGPLAQVGALVLHEVFTEREAFSTLHAAIGFLLFMGPLMADKIGAPAEAFATLRALERLPKGAMGLEVLGQGREARLGGQWPSHISHRTPCRDPLLLLTGSSQLRALEQGFTKSLRCQPCKRPLEVSLLGFGLLFFAPHAWRCNPAVLWFYILPKAVYLGWGYLSPFLLREGQGHVFKWSQCLGSSWKEPSCHVLLSGAHWGEARASLKDWQSLFLECLCPTSGVLTELLLSALVEALNPFPRGHPPLGLDFHWTQVDSWFPRTSAKCRRFLLLPLLVAWNRLGLHRSLCEVLHHGSQGLAAVQTVLPNPGIEFPRQDA